MSIIIDPEFKSLIPPLTSDEYTQLEKNIVKEGIRDPLVVWPQGDGNDILLDGHNRFRISTAHAGIPFDLKRLEFKDRDEAIVWISDNQLGRRNLHPLDRERLLSKKREALEREARRRQATSTGGRKPQLVENLPEAENHRVRDIIGKEIGVSGRQVDKLHAINEKADEQTKQLVRDGELSVNQAYKIVNGIQDGKSPAQEKKEYLQKVEDDRKVFQEKKENKVVSFTDIQEDKQNGRILAINLYTRCLSVGKPIRQLATENEMDDISLADMWENLNNEEKGLVKHEFRELIGVIEKLMEVFE